MTKESADNSIPFRIDIKREVSVAYTADEGGLFSTGFVDGRTVYNSIARMSDETFDPISPDFAVGYLDRWAWQGNAAYEDAAQFLIAEMTSYGLRVEVQRFAIEDVLGNFNPEAYNVCGFRDGTLYPDEWLVFGAHFDIAPPASAGEVDPHITGFRTYGTRVGAYDNTAGTAMVLVRRGNGRYALRYSTNYGLLLVVWRRRRSARK